jgi:glycosyltransferase involved in cell wall biosynthesis
MKVLLVHNFYQNFGGEDAAALAEQHLLETHGDSVVVYARHNKEIAEYTWIEKVRGSAESVDCTQTRDEVARIARDVRPDVAYIHNFFPLISPSIYQILHQHAIPIVQFVHDFRLFCPNGLFYTGGSICERCKTGAFFNAVRHRCYRDSYLSSFLAASIVASARRNHVFDRVSLFVCPTEFSRKKMMEGGIPADKIRTKPHFVHATGVSPKFEPGDYVLYLGRLSREKGLFTLICALAQENTVPVKIAGAGPMEKEIRSILHDQGIRHIQLVGFKSGEEKWEILRNSAFVVIPSECYETFSLSAVEAHAAGKPVIASRIGALPFVIKDGKNGLLFEPKNAADLRQGVRKLFGQRSDIERMGRYGRALVNTKYTPEHSYNCLSAIFSQAVAAGTRDRKIA